MKSNGIPKKELKEEFYKDEAGEVKFNTMKKIKFHVTSKEKNDGYSYLSIYNCSISWRFNLNSWNDREFKEIYIIQLDIKNKLLL